MLFSYGLCCNLGLTTPYEWDEENTSQQWQWRLHWVGWEESPTPSSHGKSSLCQGPHSSPTSIDESSPTRNTTATMDHLASLRIKSHSFFNHYWAIQTWATKNTWHSNLKAQMVGRIHNVLQRRANKPCSKVETSSVILDHIGFLSTLNWSLIRRYSLHLLWPILYSEETLISLLKPLLTCYDQYYRGK
jgi:hypothetical protein